MSAIIYAVISVIFHSNQPPSSFLFTQSYIIWLKIIHQVALFTKLNCNCKWNVFKIHRFWHERFGFAKSFLFFPYGKVEQTQEQLKIVFNINIKLVLFEQNFSRYNNSVFMNERKVCVNGLRIPVLLPNFASNDFSAIFPNSSNGFLVDQKKKLIFCCAKTDHSLKYKNPIKYTKTHIVNY